METVKELLLRFSSQTFAPRTIAAYNKDWVRFLAWCAAEKRAPLPADAETVLLYLTSRLQEGRKITTARRDLTAINAEHRSHGYLAPASAEAGQLLAGAQRVLCQQPTRKKPLTVEQARKICAGYEGSPAGVRDRAILTLGLASALRQSSICDLDLADVEFVERGMILRIRREKNDQKAVGRYIALVLGHPPTCPVSNLRAWLEVRGTEQGPLFTRFRNRQGKGELGNARLWPKKVSKIVKEGVRSLGLDPDRWGGHSLRAGLATAGFENGVGELRIAATTGHKSLNSLRGYIRISDPFKNNVSGLIGM